MIDFGSLELSEFKPISFCNTYSLHFLRRDNEANIFVLDINGILHVINQQITLNLKGKLGDPECNYANFDLELVASDSFLLETSNVVYLATCWVVYDKLFAPERYFAALFIVDSDFCIELVARFDIQSVPTYTRLTQKVPTLLRNNEKDGVICWLVFTYLKGAYAFIIQNLNVKPVERINEFFPVLDIRDLNGSVIRSCCLLFSNNSNRLSLVGYDTGYVIASIMQDGVITDRKSLKFDGPISILSVLDTKQIDERLEQITLLISSTLGPVTIWQLEIEEGVLTWELAGILLESDVYDSVLTATVYDNMIFIGTYGEWLLIYDKRKLQEETLPIHVENIASPILSILFVDYENLLILSSKGLHKYNIIGGNYVSKSSVKISPPSPN